MLLSLLAPIVAALSLNAQAASVPSCNAHFETTDAQGHFTSRDLPLTITYNQGDSIRLEGDLENRNFSALIDGPARMSTLFITVAPDYTDGVTAHGYPDAQGRVRVSEVHRSTVFRLECQVK